MTHFPDLQRCTYFGAKYRSLVAVGWLDKEHPFATGAIEQAAHERLKQFLVDHWEPFAAAGFHECNLCPRNTRLAPFVVNGKRYALGSDNFFVPTATEVFVAPSLLLHYIEAHGYCPPMAFQDAVLACPPMRSPYYMQLVTAHGVA